MFYSPDPRGGELRTNRFIRGRGSPLGTPRILRKIFFLPPPALPGAPRLARAVRRDHRHHSCAEACYTVARAASMISIRAELPLPSSATTASGSLLPTSGSRVYRLDILLFVNPREQFHRLLDVGRDMLSGPP
jgi:hypothetical protein